MPMATTGHPKFEEGSQSGARTRRLDAGTLQHFRHLTYPKIAAQLTVPPDSLVAIGSSIDEKPIGLALGLIARDDSAELVSILVERDYRKTGIGRRLVLTLMQELRAKGAHRIVTRIGGGNPGKSAFEHLLLDLGWSALACESIRVSGFAGAMAAEGGNWSSVRYLLENRGNITYVGWNSITEQDWRIYINLGYRRQSVKHCANFSQRNRWNSGSV